MGCEFALPFVFSPYFADTYGGKDITIILKLTQIYESMHYRNNDIG